MTHVLLAGRSITDSDLRLSEVLSALSHALDITEGQPRGHAERTCMIGMRLVAALGLDDASRSSMFYALLLKDAGCSSNAAKVAALFAADDALVKSTRRMIDTSSTWQSVVHVLRTAARDGSPFARAHHVASVLRSGRAGARALVALRCERGAEVVRAIGLGEPAARAIRDVDEHWDGGGYPDGLVGEQISVAGRVLCLAQTAEVFWRHGGGAEACRIARKRRGTWFDPTIVDALSALETDAAFWHSLRTPSVAGLEPADRVLGVDDQGLDRIVEAFASVIDAKSPYTAHHSAGVERIAVGLAATLELGPQERRMLGRAALLHDLGKLGISSRILDKPGPLTESEWGLMRCHPRWSVEILTRVSAFKELARVVGAHHERLDGSGYYAGLTGRDLDLPSRILAVADVAEALSASRPYRPAQSPDRVLDIMRPDAGSKLDAHVIAALEHVLPA